MILYLLAVFKKCFFVKPHFSPSVLQTHFGDTPRPERRRTLRRDFHFWCCCRACKEEYPRAEDLPR